MDMDLPPWSYIHPFIKITKNQGKLCQKLCQIVFFLPALAFAAFPYILIDRVAGPWHENGEDTRPEC
jgi:hypothetical protein